jgi:glycosyltransferase involved in cell wall biosynthesis
LRFSILLPTRDRLEYLRYAVETVRRQDFADWEMIVADNCSVDDVAGFVAGLDDPRVKYLRARETVPVTENWNRALDASSGDYVLMLGDDDGLMPGYFRKAEQVIAAFDEPDVVYSRALLLAYPGVMPGREAGYVHPMGCATFFNQLDEPRLLEPPVARELVRASMEFRLRFDFNMQLFTTKRSTIDVLRKAGYFFHSPFPDYYAANLLFLCAERIVIHPDPLTAIGITSKSYGFFHFNRREREGVEFLRNMMGEGDLGLERVIVPGSRMNTCWLLAMKTLADIEGGTHGLLPNVHRYRRVQIADSLRRRFVEGSLSQREARELLSALWLWEKAVYMLVVVALFLFTRIGWLPRPVLEALEHRLGQYPRWPLPWIQTGEYETMVDLFEHAGLYVGPAGDIDDLSSRLAAPP